MIGQTISHYKILEKLGEGGMGVVYKAEDTKLKRTVALKFLPKGLEAHEPERARFLQEAQAASALNHPNVCTIYDIREEGDQHFIVMEYVDGKTIRQLIPIQKMPDVINFAIQIGEALQEAHSHGIVHRDVKPENIIVNTKNQIKVMDFGLAKLKGSMKLTRTSSTVGTLAYMAPEQIQGSEVDARSDIFSFGIVLFEMLTGRLPFRGEHEAAMMYSIINEEPTTIARFNEKVTPEIEHIVIKALSKNKNERYQHVDDLLADLKSVRRQLETGAISTKSTSPYRILKVPWYVYASVGILIIILILSKISFFAPAEKPITSVAVLPFQNFSKDPEQDYFSDGMTEALISELSKIKALRVISRTSIMRFKKIDKSLPQIAGELGVDAVIEGSVQRVQDNVRITAQLVKAQPERHLWANDFNRAFKDILILQSEVAQAISREIKVTVTPEEQQRLAAARTVNPEAHEAYLRGMFYVNKVSPPDVLKGIAYLERAIEIDSTYALAYAGMGIAFDWLGSLSVRPPKETWSKVRLYATKALHFDETLAEGYMLLGDTKFTYDWDFKGAEEYFKRAIELNPNLDMAHDFYASFLSSQRRFDEAIREVKLGRSLDPLSATAISLTAAPYMFTENADSALLYINEALAIDSTHSFANRLLGCTYIGQGKSKEAIAILQRMVSRGDSSALDVLAAAYAISGQESKARELLDELTKLSKKQYVPPDLGVWAYCALGDTACLFECLEKAYEVRSSGIVFLAVQPPWCDFLQRDPRYHAMLRKVGLES